MKNKAFNACKMLNTLLGRLSAKERNTVSIIFIKKDSLLLLFLLILEVMSFDNKRHLRNLHAHYLWVTKS